MDGLSSTVYSRVKLRQNVCGGLFVSTYIVNFLFFVLKYFQVVPPTLSWYIPVLGVCSAAGYVLLYSLASSAIGEVFAGCQMALTAFYSIIIPMVIGTDEGSVPYYVILLYICAIFGVVVIYLWTILMYNGDFTKDELSWIVFLPMPYLLNLSAYFATIGNFLDSTSWLAAWYADNSLYHILKWTLMAFACVGYWKLCHTKTFAGPSSDVSFPKWTPFNRYSLSFGVAVLIVFVIFSY